MKIITQAALLLLAALPGTLLVITGAVIGILFSYLKLGFEFGRSVLED